MKIILYIFLIISFQNLYSQSFTDDYWKDFEVDNWNVKIERNDNQETYLDKEIQGKLEFQNKTDSKNQIVFYIFCKAELTEEFQNEIFNWYAIQSCFTFTDDKLSFMSFDKSEYFYLLKPCHNCNVGTNKDCEILAKEIFNYIH